MKMTRAYYFTLVLAFLLSAGIAEAQSPTGTPPFSSSTASADTIDLSNLNIHLDIPVRRKAGRSMNFNYDLSYDSLVWYSSSVNGVQTWTRVNNSGWRQITEAKVGYISYSTQLVSCGQGEGDYAVYSNYVYHDGYGDRRPCLYAI